MTVGEQQPVVVRQHTTTAFALAAVLLIALHAFDNRVYDHVEAGLWGVRGAAGEALRGPAGDPGVVVVAVDEASGRAIPSRWPWDRRFMAKALDALTEAGARSVGLFFYYGQASAEDPGQDQALADALRRNGRTTILSYADFEQGEGRLVLPLELFSAAAAGVGYPLFVTDRQGQATAVRAYGFAQDPTQFGFPLAALRTHLDVKSFNLVASPDAVELRPAAGQDWPPLLLPLDGRGALALDYRWLPAIPVVPFHELHAGTVDPARFRGKLVLVGGTAKFVHDECATPLGKPLGGVQIAACALASALAGEVPRWAPAWGTLLTQSVAAGGLAFLGSFAPPGYHVLALAGLLTAWWALALGLGGAGLLLVPLARPTGLFVLVGLASLLRWRYRSFLGVTEVADAAVEAGAQRALGLGMKLLNEGRIEESLKYFQKVAALESTKRSDGQYYMAVVLLKKGDMQVAANLISSLDVKKLAPDRAYTLAQELERQGQLETAAQLYQQLYVTSATFKDVGTRLDALRQKLSQVDQGDVANLIAQRILDRRYREVKLLGHGGMGFVYQALDAQAGDRPVAIKVMSPFYANDEKVRERFIREARGISAFVHPALIRIYDVFEANLPYYTMEFLGGWQEMSALLVARGRLAPEAAVRILAQVCGALEVAHGASIVHRDLKPQNIMLDQAWNAKLIDFGIAKFESKAELTRTGQALGTPLYMSPEQVKGQEVDNRSDIYSLGVVLYQSVVGRPPFQDMQHHIHKPVPPPPPELALPPALVAVIMRALAKRTEERFDTIVEFRDALLAAVPGAAAARADAGKAGGA